MQLVLVVLSTTIMLIIMIFMKGRYEVLDQAEVLRLRLVELTTRLLSIIGSTLRRIIIIKNNVHIYRRPKAVLSTSMWLAWWFWSVAIKMVRFRINILPQLYWGKLESHHWHPRMRVYANKVSQVMMWNKVVSYLANWTTALKVVNASRSGDNTQSSFHIGCNTHHWHEHHLHDCRSPKFLGLCSEG